MGLIILSLALAIQAAEPKPIVVTGSAWAPFISPMGEPFRSRSLDEDTLATWFQQADRNGDSILSAAELDDDALRFFGTLDSDSNRQILPEEMAAYELQVAPEVQVNTRWRDARGAPVRKKRSARQSGYDPYALQGAARYALIDMPQPVAAADTNFDRAVTLDEFRLAAAHRFQLLDTNGDRQLDLAELRTFLPLPRHLQKRKGFNKEPRDTRVGTPVPVSR